MQEVFISYSSKEASKAYAIKDVLEKNDISCWMAPESIPDGSDYTHEIPVAIRNCKVFLVLISNISQTSIWVKNEVDTAVNSNKVVIPYMLEECELTDEFNFLLTGRQRVDAYHKKAEKLRRLVKRIQIELAAEDDIDSVDMGINNNSKKKRKYSKAIVAVAISLLVLVPLIVLGIGYLARFESQKYEIESFYIFGETEQQYYDEVFVFSGKSKAPIIKIYVTGENFGNPSRKLLAKTETMNGEFRFETVGELWWYGTALFEIIPCDYNGNELLEFRINKELIIDRKGALDDLYITNDCYNVKRGESVTIIWTETYYPKGITYTIEIIPADLYQVGNTIHINDSVFYKEGIEKGEYTLSETDTQRIPTGEYIIMVSSELKGYSGCVDDAFFVVEE